MHFLKLFYVKKELRNAIRVEKYNLNKKQLKTKYTCMVSVMYFKAVSRNKSFLTSFVITVKTKFTRMNFHMCFQIPFCFIWTITSINRTRIRFFICTHFELKEHTNRSTVWCLEALPTQKTQKTDREPRMESRSHKKNPKRFVSPMFWFSLPEIMTWSYNNNMKRT